MVGLGKRRRPVKAPMDVSLQSEISAYRGRNGGPKRSKPQSRPGRVGGMQTQEGSHGSGLST